MARDLSGKRVAILATDGVERVELEQPRGALYGAGADTELLSIHPGEIQARQFDLVSAARSRSTSSSPTPPRMTTTLCCCREAPSTLTSCGSTRTRWRSSGPSPRQASPSRRSATARGHLSLRALSAAADSPPGPACAMICAMRARSRSTSKSSSTASSPPAAPRRTCPLSARRSSSSSPAAGCQASHRRASAVPGDPGFSTSGGYSPGAGDGTEHGGTMSLASAAEMDSAGQLARTRRPVALAATLRR